MALISCDAFDQTGTDDVEATQPSVAATIAPTPQPAEFEIGPVQTADLNGERQTVAVEFRFEVSNTGGVIGPSPETVAISIDDAEPIPIAEIGQLDAGSSLEVSGTLDLVPGAHRAVIQVGGARRIHNWNVRDADLAIAYAGRSLADEETVIVEFEVENRGTLPAETASVEAEWRLVEGDAGEGFAGRSQVELQPGLLAPGARRSGTVAVKIPRGTYDFALETSSESIDSDASNNRVEFRLDVDFVQILTNAEFVGAADWGRDGRGIARIDAQFNNLGTAPSGPIQVGIVCEPAAGSDCSQSQELDSIPAGARQEASFLLRLPAGLASVKVFAGEPDETYRWGSGNLLQLSTEIPPQPARQLRIDSAWRVVGYGQDGVAEIELQAILRNVGSEPQLDSIPVTVTCWRNGESEAGCGAESDLEFADGFGPINAAFKLDVPMGTSIQATVADQSPDAARFMVPERVIGVERYIWECFRERFGPTVPGCSGSESDFVIKWPRGQTVNVWASGDPEYVAVFEEMVPELSNLLALEIVRTQSQSDAQIILFLGTSRTATNIRWAPCNPDADGCTQLDTEDGTILGSQIGIWNRGSPSDSAIRRQVRTALLREFIYANSGFKPRFGLEAQLGKSPAVSPLEAGMIRLNSHPLIEPGMTIDEVRNLVVLRDELLTPQPPGDYGLAYVEVHDAIAKLADVKTARFTLSGNWSGTCGDHQFGPGTYEIGDIRDPLQAIEQYSLPGFVRFASGGQEFVYDRFGLFLARQGGQWRPVDIRELEQMTSWRPGFSDIYTLLRGILRVDDPAKLTVSRLDNVRISIESTMADQWGAAWRMTVVIDSASNEIDSFAIAWTLPGPCYHSVNAWSGQYGVELLDYQQFR